MKSRVNILVLSVGLLASSAAADSLLVFGLGQVGSWNSELTVSSTESAPTTVMVSFAPDQICPPLTACHNFADIAPFGTALMPPPYPDSFVGVGYVVSSGASLPAVAGRAFDNSCRSADLPVFRVSALLYLNPNRLFFPGAQSGQKGRSNLLLANIGEVGVFDGEPVTLRIDVLDGTGVTVGSSFVSLEYRHTVLLYDVVQLAGVMTLTDGQVIVTKVGGNGRFWGVMPTVRHDGGLTISGGMLP